MNTQSTAAYAGADWLKTAFNIQISEFGRQVADLLGDIYLGIYHVNIPGLKKADWRDDHCIRVTVRADSGHLATTDFNLLTRLVVLAHDRCIRVAIEPASPVCLRLVFTPRVRDGSAGQRHPALEPHVQLIREAYPPREALI